MVETKRVILLNIPTLGAGQPDYAQPQSITTTEQTLIVKYPETEISANRYDDYAELHITNTQQTEYVVGTNANLQKAGTWEAGVFARSMDIYASAEILVRFNYADAVQHTIPQELLKSFSKRIERLFLQSRSATATVKLWIEG